MFVVASRRKAVSIVLADGGGTKELFIYPLDHRRQRKVRVIAS
jgi:hypothetical protein